MRRVTGCHACQVGLVALPHACRYEEPRGAEGESLGGVTRTDGNGAPVTWS